MIIGDDAVQTLFICGIFRREYPIGGKIDHAAEFHGLLEGRKQCAQLVLIFPLFCEGLPRCAAGGNLNHSFTGKRCCFRAIGKPMLENEIQPFLQ